jgi:hypothetical protein
LGLMEDFVDLGDTSPNPSTQPLGDQQYEFGSQFLDDPLPGFSAPAATRRASRGRGGSLGSLSSSAPCQSLPAPPHKARGPNWTESEMLVLIGQKRIEWDGRHNCNRPSLAKFVYGSTAWKVVLAGCMSVVGFRVRDADQITNKWDGLVKEYKKLKDYIEGSGSANWWGMSREEKKELSRTRRMPLEFTESMYTEMESFVGKRQIFGKAVDVVDSDRPPAHARRPVSCSPPAAFIPSCIPTGSPTTSATTTPNSVAPATPGDDTPGSTGRKRKSSGSDNLVDFVRDFNCEYLSRVETQERDKRVWRSDVMAFDAAREARMAKKDAETLNMDQRLYELEAERTKNLGNMTTALLMLASSMDALTRFIMQSLTLALSFIPIVLFLKDVWRCSLHFVCAQGSQECPLSPSCLPARLFPRSQGPLALEGGKFPHPPHVRRR